MKVFKVFKLYKLLISTILVILSSSIPNITVFSQNFSDLNPGKRPSQYIMKHWNTEDGLTSESTNDLIQSEDGYIWIGTYTGLHRFDGKNISNFTATNSNLPSSNVLRMDIDSKGTLWLGTLHGICTFKNGEFSIPKSLESVKNYSIETIIITKNDDVWFSTKSNHLFRLKNNQLSNLTDEFNVSNHTVLTIAESQDGTIYIGTDGSQLYSYKNEVIKEIKIDKEVNGLYKIIASKSLTYIATGKGLYMLQNGSITKATFLRNTPINTLIENQNGILWIGTMRGLFRYNPIMNKLDSITEKNGLPNNNIRDLLYDKEGNLWGGTYRNGIFLLSDGSITSYSKFDGLSSNLITAITEIEDQVFLMGAENGDLSILKKGKIHDFEPELKIPKARLKHLFTDKDKRIWISTYGGLILLDGNNSRNYNIGNGFPDNFIRQVYQDHKGGYLGWD